MKKEMVIFIIGEIVGVVIATIITLAIMNTPAKRLDTNRDGEVNVLDTIEIVNYTLNK
jgi:hypothetical protein